MNNKQYAHMMSDGNINVTLVDSGIFLDFR